MNDFNISQVATIVNNIAEQMTGQRALTQITNAADFIAVAQTLLKTGYDPVINAISQVFSRSIFSYRDYAAPLNSLYMDAPRWGNAVRKLSPVAMEAVNNQEFEYPVAYSSAQAQQSNPYGDGLSVDHYKINKQKVLQTNFYGSATYAQRYTIFKDQFEVAFTSPEEFGRFTAMLAAERKNDRETYKESLARGLQASFIGAIFAENKAERIVHLLTEYNTVTGLELTAATVYQPENFAPFMRWAYARIKTIARLMANRSAMFQTQITGKTILRHTPADRLRIAIFSPVLEQMDAMVLSTTFNDEYFENATIEGVDYWQSIQTPDAINVVPVYTNANGALTTGAAQNKTKIFGLIHDKDALGYSDVNNWAAVTPLNIDGGYWNEAHHTRFKSMLDNTEKAVVLVLD